MKRIAILLAGIMLAAAGLVIAPATALAYGHITCTASPAIAHPGDTVTVTFSVTSRYQSPAEECVLTIDNLGSSESFSLEPDETIAIPFSYQVTEADLVAGEVEFGVLLACKVKGESRLTVGGCTVTIKPPLTIEVLTSFVEAYAPKDPLSIKVRVTNNTGSDMTGVNVVCGTDGDVDQGVGPILVLPAGSDDFSFTFSVTESQLAAEAAVISASVSAEDAYGNPESASTQKTIRVGKPSIADCEITLNPLSYGYNGSPQMPTVTVKDGDTSLTEGEDYEVELRYDGNKVERAVNAGDYMVRIKGKGNYGGELDKEFKITPRTITAYMIDDISPVEYAGSPVTPEVTVKDGETTLTLGTDYKLACINNDGPGTGTVTVTGQGNYTGEVTKVFTINAPAFTVEILTKEAQAYYVDGQFKFDIQVKVTNNTGAPIEDFTWSCREAGQTGLTLETGETTLTITLQAAKGEVRGSAILDFDVEGEGIGSNGVYGTNPLFASAHREVELKPITITEDNATLVWTETVYSGKSQMPQVTVKYRDLTLTPGTDYIVELYHDDEIVGSAVDVGEYTLKITGNAAFQGEVEKKFTINPRTITAYMIDDISPVEYAGSPVTPEVTVKDGEKVLTLGTDYKLDYGSNEGPGTGKVKVTGQGNYTGEVTKEFTINAPAPTYSLTIVFAFDPAVTGYRYGDKLSGTATVKNTGSGPVNFVLTWVLYDRPWNYLALVEGCEVSQPFTYVVTYADVEAGMITTAGNAMATGPNGEEIPVTITFTDATSTVIPTPTTITLDLGEGTLDGKTGKVTIDANVGQPYQLPTEPPVLDGYTFQYYRGSEYYPGDTYIVEADHTLTAVYKKNQPTIPDTGDAAPIALAFALLVLSASGLAFARKRG